MRRRFKAEPLGYVVSKAAIDGSLMSAIPSQLETVPADTTHLVLSVGEGHSQRPLLLIASPYISYIDTRVA
jgi:hypothetical protein